MSTTELVLPADAGRETERTVRVWDPFVRLFHWSLVALFVFAFATGDEWDAAHETAGYVIAGLVAARVVWGLVGTRHARFADFVHSPATILGYLRDSLYLRPKRYLGHNPAGGVMIIALLAMISLIAGSGYAMTTDTFWGREWVEELHETAVYLTIALIALHVAGVALASLEHRENLVKAMFTGRKRAE
jgi:cytochrome b